jgi:hypothetical protein
MTVFITGCHVLKSSSYFTACFGTDSLQTATCVEIFHPIFPYALAQIHYRLPRVLKSSSYFPICFGTDSLQTATCAEIFHPIFPYALVQIHYRLPRVLKSSILFSRMLWHREIHDFHVYLWILPVPRRTVLPTELCMSSHRTDRRTDHFTPGLLKLLHVIIMPSHNRDKSFMFHCAWFLE